MGATALAIERPVRESGGPAAAGRASQRVLSVDVLRGMTIALMILVNDPGDWNHVFAQLDHATWNGWTLTDLVFPTFLFLMGTSMVFSLEARTRRGDCWKTLSGHVVGRSAKILLLAFVLVYFPRMHWRTLRLYGVLTRIGLCYLVAGLVLVAVLRSGHRVRWIAGTVAALLIGYWILLRWVPVPGAGMPVRDVPLLDPMQNLTAWLDRAAMAWTQRWLHTGTLYQKTRDPEGLLSTLPAVASVLLGSLAGLWMRRDAAGRTVIRMRWWLVRAGVAGVAAGEIWAIWLPINKNLWTSSYVLLAAGWAALALAGVSALVDSRRDKDDREQPWPRWLRVCTWPWLVFGSNAIVAFTMSVVLVKGLIFWKMADVDGAPSSAWTLIYERGFVAHGANGASESTVWTSLAFAVAVVVVCFLPNWWLWRRKWFVKM